MKTEDYSMENLKVVILAAGKGTRLSSEQIQIPKHLREIAGKPILGYILETLNFMENKKDIVIVVGYLKEMIMDSFPEYMFAIQGETGYGTGYAVKCAKNAIGDYTGNIMVLLGDMPLITTETINNFINSHNENKNQCTILSCNMDKGMTFGRIIRDENNIFVQIIENRDCPPELKYICEYNTGIMIFDSKKLFEQLDNLKNNNSKEEYYLTDVPKLFLENNYKVGVYNTDNKNEFYGADSMKDLKNIENIIKPNSTK